MKKKVHEKNDYSLRTAHQTPSERMGLKGEVNKVRMSSGLWKLVDEVKMRKLRGTNLCLFC